MAQQEERDGGDASKSEGKGSRALPELIPARMVNEVLYCERLMYLEWVQGQFSDNAYTVEGRLVHKRADAPSGELPPAKPQEKEEPAPQQEEPPYTAKSVWLSSEGLGITSRIDVVEGTAQGTVMPIEYKRGEAPDLPEGAYLPERAQVCAQVMLLRECGYRCERGAIYFAGSKRRVDLEIDSALEQTVRSAVERAKRVAKMPAPPEPLKNDPRCNGCSLVGICLPDETNYLQSDLQAKELPKLGDLQSDPLDLSEGDPWELSGLGAEGMRRLHPARDERLPVYVQEQGAKVTLDGEELAIRSKSGCTTAQLGNTSQVSLYGNVQITTQAIRALMERGIPIAFFSYGGWLVGRALGLEPKNVDLRIAQHRASTDQGFCLAMAQRIVESKIRNCRTMLRRNHPEAPSEVLAEMDVLATKATQAESLETLLGLEGTGARTYFRHFTGMLKGEAAELGAFDLEGRNRRPPRDPINALLSYAYSLLTKDFASTVGTVGLDPMLGYYHQPRFGRPALALDLMEEFRPLIADSMVIGVINNAVIEPSDFVSNRVAVALKPEARKKLLLAYERRMDQLVTHPVFGYRISYRRVLEVQARLLGRLLMGEIREYPSFRTR